MAEIIRENPVGDFIHDLLDVLESNMFDEVIWVGMHEWLSYVTRVFWMKGYKFKTAITPVDSRWGQEVYEDDEGHTIKITSLDYAREIGNKAVYIIANNYVEDLKNQLIEMGLSPSRIFGFNNGATYHQEANNRLTAKLKEGYKPMSHKEIQGVLLNLLKEFKHFCEEYNLTYYLDGGTLLGAVRHQGFIPWDNDADVVMPFDDYKKLISLYPSGGKYELIDWSNNDKHRKGFAELGYNDTCVHNPYYVVVEPVHIDIFPVIEYPDDLHEMDMLCKTCAKLSQQWRECAILSDFGIEDNCEEIFERFYEKRMWNSNKMGAGYFRTGPIIAHDKKCFSGIRYMTFEGEKFAVPIGWDDILRAYYRDYMNMPPAEGRVGYPNKCYWKGAR